MPSPHQQDDGAGPLLYSDAYTLASQGGRAVIVGDSLSLGGSTVSPTTSIFTRAGADWLAWASFLSAGKIMYVYNGGVGGDTLSRIVGRLQGILDTYTPGICFFTGGTNDVGTLSVDGFAALIKEGVSRIRNANALPVLVTLPPRNDNTTYRPRIEAFNVWLKNYANRNGIPIIDPHRIVTDATDGSFTLSLSSDGGLHYNEAAAKLIGQEVVDQLSTILPPAAPCLAMHAGAATPNKMSNGLFLASAGGLATGWVNVLGVGTPSIVAGTGAVRGNWQRITVNPATSTAMLQAAVASLPAAGKLVGVGCRMESTNDATAGSAALNISVYSGSAAILTFNPVTQWTSSPTSGIVYGEFVMPEGATSMYVSLLRYAGTAGIGYTQIAQLAFLELG